MIGLAASAEDPFTLYAATRAGLLGSRDGGKIWQAAYPARQPASAVEVAPDGTAYAFIVGEGLLRRTDPSESWQVVNNKFSDRVLLHRTVDPADPSRVFAVTDSGALVASSDGGENWTAFEG